MISIFRTAVTLALSLSFTACVSTNSPESGRALSTGIEPKMAMQALKDGNDRYLSGDVRTHDWLHERIAKTGQDGQTPSVGILTCADSRTPPELIFDQGVGSLFVVRIAGNFQNDVGIGTFEYGVAALGVHTIVVLGHTKCGAVNATVEGKELPGRMSSFVAAIRPALANAPKGADGRVSTTDAEIANVRWQAAELVKRSDILTKAVADGNLQVVGAMYDVETGAVRFLD
jgi:carbonic anhydrase